MDWRQRLKSLVVDDNVRGRINSKLIDVDAERLENLFDGNDDVVRASLLGLVEPAAAADKLTEFEWLRQGLPLWDSGRFCTTPSATGRERMYRPVSVRYWDVVKDIEEYLNKADKLTPIHQEVDDSHFAVSDEGNSEGIATFILTSIIVFVKKMQPGSLVTWGQQVYLLMPRESLTEGGESTNSDGSKAKDKDVQKAWTYARPPRADIMIKSNRKHVAAIELKNGGLECPVHLYKLWATCSCLTGVNPNCWCKYDIKEEHARSILNCILQLYEYLVLAEVGYGVLSDAQNWYLFKRDHDGHLYISTVFKLNGGQTPLLAALVYLVNSAVENRGMFDGFPKNGERPWSLEAAPCPSSSSSHEDVKDEDSTYKPNERKSGGHITSPARTRWAQSNARQSRMQEIPASDLHLDDSPISSGGWSGCVVGGSLNGRRVAVKLAPRNSERAEALLNEVDAYQKLQEYWGEFVPSLVGFGTTANGQIVFIAVELIDGSPLVPTVTEKVATAALRALDAVHACKVLHGDVEARNIMVVRGTQASVRLIDFGFARCTSNRNLQKAELWKLQRLMQDMMGVGVGKESGARYPHKAPFQGNSNDGDSSCLTPAVQAGAVAGAGELSALQGLSLISCKEPLQGTMLEKMQGARILILHDTGVKGYCTKPLNQLQFLYWGRSKVAPDVRIPFQMRS